MGLPVEHVSQEITFPTHKQMFVFTILSVTCQNMLADLGRGQLRSTHNVVPVNTSVRSVHCTVQHATLNVDEPVGGEMLRMPRYISLDRHRTTTVVTKYTEKSTRYRTRVGVVLFIRHISSFA